MVRFDGLFIIWDINNSSVIGINMDEKNKNKIILITTKSNYPVWCWWPIPNILIVPLANNWLGIIKNRRYLMRGQWSVFCKHHSSGTSYQDSTDWLQYRMNLVTIVPIYFQQKKNINLNDWLDLQNFLVFSDLTQYAKWFLLCVVS